MGKKVKGLGMAVELNNGDCFKYTETVLSRVDAVVTDPPYGCKNNCDYTRFSGGLSPHRNYHSGIIGDDKPFSPSPWLAFPQVVLWGYQFFADKVPQGTVLVWNKRRESKLGKFMSDCELAWQKGGKGVYLFNHVWDGFDRETERGKVLHPSQKPVALMAWCIERITKPGDTVFDPFMGSGATGVACVQTGRNFIGCEIDENYFNIAKRRIEQAQMQMIMPLTEGT